MMTAMLTALSLAMLPPIHLDPPASELNWTNSHGGPLVERGDPAEKFTHHQPPSLYSLASPAPPPLSTPSPFKFTRYPGFLAAGNDIKVIEVSSLEAAIDACSGFIECRGLCFSTGVNGTITNLTKVFLKRIAAACHGAHCKTLPWTSYVKEAPVDPPALIVHDVGGLNASFRSKTFTLSSLNATRATKIVPDGYSFVPMLNPGSALPLVQHLGDVTLRVRKLSPTSTAPPPSSEWQFLASAWGPFTAEATQLPPASDEYLAHDITKLVEAAGSSKSPLRVRRSYLKPSQQQPGLGMQITLTNVDAHDAVEIGGFGFSFPSFSDVHIGGAHGWVEWMRVLISKNLTVEGQCMIATPLNGNTKLENWRPMFEFGGGGYEWSVHTAAWADEWERNVQWPFLYMTEQLNATGLWPNPKSPWPGWGDGGATVRVNMTRDTHWNQPTSKVLQPNESVTYGLRLAACKGGPRTRDEALLSMNAPVMNGVPGYTIATDMSNASLDVTLPISSMSVKGVVSSAPSVLTAGTPYKLPTSNVYRIPVNGASRGRSRLEVTLSDGTIAVAHYLVLPSLPLQITRVAKHWSEVAWLPKDYPDPFGRGASVLPWDREDLRHRFDDGRAYDVGLSDDAGAANNLGLATSQAYSPFASAVAKLDEYVEYTLYGTKPKTAKQPLKSLQYPHPNNGVRMTLYYYNQSYFPYNYTEKAECGVVAGLNYNWCMTEHQANATYRGFNYPHQIAVWYSLYRVARNHPKIRTTRSWEYYLERAANTTIRLGYARIGYMDGTVTREVLRSVLEEAKEAKGSGLWTLLGQHILAGEKSRADYFVTAPNPYGSEFSYDTTGQEEVVVWLLYFNHDSAANRTIEHILQYMRPLPNWAYNGGAQAGDVANGGKWLVTAGTGYGDSGKMHYRAGLNAIPLIEWYRRHPDDITTLEIAIGAQSGQMSNIDKTGAPAIYFHDYPHIMEHDAYSGDYGLGFFGSSLEACSTFVVHPSRGPLCFLCNLGVEEKKDGTVSYSIEPRDSYRQRVYLEPLGLYLQADSGTFEKVSLKMSEKRIEVTFAAVTEQTYTTLRLRADKLVVPPSSRPGSNFKVLSPKGVPMHRAAYEIPPPAVGQAASVVIGFD